MNKELVNKIITELDIISVISSFLPLEKRGNNYLAICPFHQDSKPSLTISPSKKIFKCFSCQESGNVLDFVIKFNNFSFTNALKYLNENFNLNLNLDEMSSFENKPLYNEFEQKLIKANEDANMLFKLFLLNQQKSNFEISSFIQNRFINDEIIKVFELGFAPNDNKIIELLSLKNNQKDILINASLITENENSFFKNRIMFPIKNQFGNIVGFSGRVISDKSNQVKYLNSAQNKIFSKSKILFNYKNAIDFLGTKNELIICEGFMDVIALYKANIKNAVALMGTALTEEHIKLLLNKHVILLLDGDKAGVEATKKSLKILLKNNIKVEIIKNDTNYDPDEYLNIFGQEKLKEMLNNRISPLSFLYKEMIINVDKNDFISVDNFIKDFKDFLVLADYKEKSFILEKIERELNINPKIFNLQNNEIKYKSFSNYNQNPNKQKKVLNLESNVEKIRKQIITSICLIEEIEKNFMQNSEKFNLLVSDKKNINKILKYKTVQEKTQALNESQLFIETYAKDLNDLNVLINNYKKINEKIKVFKIQNIIKELEKEKENCSDIDEKEKIDEKILSFISLLNK
ncbi:DNA primase [Mycoplasma sp. 480]|uniref:DNA primase n=1 Tax=Mycoplasma sp. 480 TaxID=3440155 RepID=UPI003F512214